MKAYSIAGIQTTNVQSMTKFYSFTIEVHKQAITRGVEDWFNCQTFE